MGWSRYICLLGFIIFITITVISIEKKIDVVIDHMESDIEQIRMTKSWIDLHDDMIYNVIGFKEINVSGEHEE